MAGVTGWITPSSSWELARGIRAPHDHSKITFPVFPDRIASKPFWKSRYENRCVITGRMSRPDSSITVILYQVSYISRP